jgi:hypothetical protein
MFSVYTGTYEMFSIPVIVQLNILLQNVFCTSTCFEKTLLQNVFCTVTCLAKYITTKCVPYRHLFS